MATGSRVLGCTGQTYIEPVRSTYQGVAHGLQLQQQRPCWVWTPVTISIMLWVMSGVTVPGKGWRPNKANRSLALLEKSRSRVLTNCNSSSTPMHSIVRHHHSTHDLDLPTHTQVGVLGVRHGLHLAVVQANGHIVVFF